MRIGETARKHGVPDEDIWHAVRNAMRYIDQDDVAVIVGPARNGDLLEVGVLDPEGDALIIHAMPARPDFLPYL